MVSHTKYFRGDVMKFSKLIIGLLAICLLGFNLQAQARDGRHHRHHNNNNDLLWIGAGAAVLTAAAIAASENDDNAYRCRVWHRGQLFYGYHYQGRPTCVVEFDNGNFEFRNYRLD